MKIYLATDHAAFELKEYVKTHLLEGGYNIEDCGAFTLDPNDDYPDWVKLAAQRVAQNPDSMGIVFGKSGSGEAIVANKIKGVRAILAVNEENVRLSREHNNANVLSIGSILIPNEQATSLIRLFINTPFSNEERHVRRIEKISQIENE
ncbi:MAG: RpiB/LacA/LacB family sugar-phosphate isomerase [Candidatus Levybacteria bacterium]|nr:RpiB/LacA/LacB family sugar-phosphate isomerase [Candidatus Levybacteria bacterium]